MEHWLALQTCSTVPTLMSDPLAQEDVSSGIQRCKLGETRTSQMLHMAYDPSKGLGKQQTGIIEPICPTPRQQHTGLGYPNL